MQYGEWLRCMDQNNIPALTLCCVEEGYLKDLVRHSVYEQWEEESIRDFNCEEVSFPEVSLQKMEEMWETLPVFGEYRFLLFYDMPLDKERVKANEEKLNALVRYAQNPNPKTKILLFFEGKKPFAGKLWKQLEKHVETLLLYRLTRIELERFLRKKFQKNRVEILPDAVSFLMDASGYLDYQSTQTLHDVDNELEKLVSGAKDGKLDVARVQQLFLSGKEEGVFSVLDSIWAGDLGKFFSHFQQYVAQYGDLFGFFNLWLRQIRLMIGLKCLQREGLSLSQAQSRLGISRYESRKLWDSMARYRISALLRLHLRCWELEKRLKTGKTDIMAEIECMVGEFLLAEQQ